MGRESLRKCVIVLGGGIESEFGLISAETRLLHEAISPLRVTYPPREILLQ